MIFEKKSKDSELLAITFLNQKMDNTYALLSRLMEKITSIERMVQELKTELELIKSKLKVEELPMPLSERTKELIKTILKRNPFLSAQDIAKIIGLSRTRVVEYLVEMEQNGIVKSKYEGKKKLYYLP